MKNHWIKQRQSKPKMMSDYDILRKWLKYSDEEAKQLLKKLQEKAKEP